MELVKFIGIFVTCLKGSKHGILSFSTSRASLLAMMVSIATVRYISELLYRHGV